MLSPLRLLVLLLVLWRLSRRSTWRWMGRPVLILASVLAVTTTPLGANALVWLQEARAPAASACSGPPPSTIVVLSGGVATAPDAEDDFGALELASLQRLFGAIALYRRLDSPQLVIIGTSGRAFADSRIMAALARQLGVADATLRVETASLNTWQNAQASATLVPPLPQRIWLVTSALHMARAAYAFRTAGFEVCPLAVHSRYQPFDGLGYLIPNGSATVKAEEALHELVGDVAYRMRALFADRSKRVP